MENVLEVTPEKLKELIDSGAIVLEGEGNGEEEEEEDLSPTQVLSIPGLDDIEIVGIKTTVLTPGTTGTGTIVIEIEAKPGLNSFLYQWMNQSLRKDIKLQTSDSEETLIETWEMSALPEAISFGETGEEEKGPWLTTIQLTFKDLKIT